MLVEGEDREVKAGPQPNHEFSVDEAPLGALDEVFAALPVNVLVQRTTLGLDASFEQRFHGVIGNEIR